MILMIKSSRTFSNLIIVVFASIYSVIFLLIDIGIISASLHLYWGLVIILLGGIVRQLYLFLKGTTSQQAEAEDKLIKSLWMVAGAAIIVGLVALTALFD